jgi:serine protease inhibitor
MNSRRLAIALALLVAACGTSQTDKLPGDRSDPIDLHAVALSAGQLDDMARADSAFGTSLFAAAAARQDGNLVMSPASIAIALQMAYAGARGRTAEEMADVLHVAGTSPTKVAAAAAQFLTQLASASKPKGPILSLVNEVWLQDGFPLTTSYRTSMSSGFAAAFRRADFRDNPDRVRQDINNAVDTMQQLDAFGYVHRDGYQVIELPYARDRLAMTLLIPDGSPGPLLRRMTSEGLGALSAGAKPTLLSLHCHGSGSTGPPTRARC